jgi:septal ring factor EnvC (AmiA/AmiB activator)
MNHRPDSALAVIVAALATGCGFDTAKLEKQENEISRLRTEILQLTNQLNKANIEIEVQKANCLRADEDVKATRAKAEAVRKELEASRTELLNYRRDFQLQSRVRAVGQQFPELATLDGKTYREVRIRAVLTDTVQISHADGQAKIALANLGPQWLKRFDVGTGDAICLIGEDVLKEACARAAKSR